MTSKDVLNGASTKESGRGVAAPTRRNHSLENMGFSGYDPTLKITKVRNPFTGQMVPVDPWNQHFWTQS